MRIFVFLTLHPEAFVVIVIQVSQSVEASGSLVSSWPVVLFAREMSVGANTGFR